ncbi:MAG: hypothetical protein AAB426_05260 [Myxococcota bacterium]
MDGGPLPETVREGRAGAPAVNRGEGIGGLSDLHVRSTLPLRALADIAAPPSFRFADNYTTAEILTDPAKAAELTRRYVDQEAKFFAIARHPKSGLTYDGVNLDLKTGRVSGVRNWSAPSKECLDLGIWIKALGGDRRAARLVAGGNTKVAIAKAAEVLDQKLRGYWRFYDDNPGYAGFLPWFKQAPDGTITSTDDWQGDIPGLDNGEWVWTLLTAEKALRDAGFTDLADRYGAYNKMLRANVVKVFYDAEVGKVRADVHIRAPHRATTGYDSIADRPGRMSFLTGEHGVHEGLMMVLYLTLFGVGLPDGAACRIWDGIPIKRQEKSPYGTTWEAYWGSAHESWAYLFLPLRDLPAYRDLFRIREKIRTQNAAAREYPGLASSTNAPGGSADLGYLSAAGIEGLGSQAVHNNHVYAQYGAFPLLLEHSTTSDKTVGNYGLAWLHNMLRAPKAQGPLGGGESGTNDGSAIAPMKTIDGSLPLLLGMMGGVEQETAAMLREQGAYERFRALMQRQYDRGFGTVPLREPVGFARPNAVVPHGHLEEYTG